MNAGRFGRGPSATALTPVLVSFLAATALGACSSEAPPPAPKACCEQATIPPGVTPFKIVAEELVGPSDGLKVRLRAALLKPAQREALYPVLHTLYRHGTTRGPLEPIEIVGQVFASEADAQSGAEAKLIGSIVRTQTDRAPTCDNRVAYNFSEQVDRAFAASLGRAPREDVDDTCHINPPKAEKRVDADFKHKPTYSLDAAGQSVEVTFPYLEMGQDEYLKELKLASALTYWTEFMTSMFRRVGDLKEVRYIGVHQDVPVLKIAVTRSQFESDLAGLQETIAAHAAITFQTLGMRRTTDKKAEKEQNQFKVKTYKEALAGLPKSQVTISPKLK